MDEEQKNTTPKIDGEPLSRVKTYQDAIKEALRSQEMSAAGMLMAEQKKRDNFQKESEAHSISNPRNKMLVTISIVLVVAAGAVATFAIINANKRPAPDTGFVMRSKYFLSEKMIEIASSQLSRNTLARIQQVGFEPTQSGTINQIVVTKEVRTDPSSSLDLRTKVSYDTNDFLSLLNSRTPDSLRGTLDPEFMLGVHGAPQRNEKFVLFRINDFESAFSGMFTWESALARDMENIFPAEIGRARTVVTEEVPPAPTTESTSTATTTDEEVSDATTTPEMIQRTIDNTRTWHDRVIRNTDTRALLDDAGRVVFFYAFIDKEYIFFGTREETFAEVMRRVRSAKLIR